MEIVIDILCVGVGALLGVILGNIIIYFYKSKPLRLNYARIMPDVPQLNFHRYEGDSGYDLRTCLGVTILPHEMATIPTGLILEIPKGYEGQIRGRSGWAGCGLQTHVGTIDSAYRGQVYVVIHNTRDRSWDFDKGDRVAQLVISKVEHPNIEEVDKASMIPTERGDKGFGSTGVV